MPNILTNKLGPLPTWGWLGIITAGGLAYYLHTRNSAAAAGTAPAGQVPDYVFQNYNQLPQGYSQTPASAPPPGPHGHHGTDHDHGTGHHPAKGGGDKDRDVRRRQPGSHHGGRHSSGLRSITPAQAAHLIRTGHKAAIRRRHGKPYLTGADYQRLITAGGRNHPGQFVPAGG